MSGTTLTYQDSNKRAKHVRYWHMTPLGTVGVPDSDEIDMTRWVPLSHAASVLSRKRDRAVLDAFRREHGPVGSLVAWNVLRALAVPHDARGVPQAARDRRALILAGSALALALPWPLKIVVDNVLGQAAEGRSPRCSAPARPIRRRAVDLRRRDLRRRRSKGQASADRVQEVLQVEATVRDLPGAGRCTACAGTSRCARSRSATTRPGRSSPGVTITAMPGQMIALAGPTGAG